MTGNIEAIYVSANHGEPKESIPHAELRANVGLIGDRYAGGGVVSIIEAEAVEAFNESTGLSVSADETGRNVVTRGIRLNDLVGRTFRLGGATLKGFELCEPCLVLGSRLATASVRPHEVVKAFTHSAGIRALVVASGRVSPGDDIEVRIA
ncbi:MAG: sulfurase [Gammaproteobacteria bacterium]|nr:sulfurase [Gammaproteobacteria bacterium]